MAWYKKYKPEVVIGKASFVLPLFRKMGISVPGDVAFVDVFLEEANGRIAGVNRITRPSARWRWKSGRQLQHNKYGVPEIPTTTFVEAPGTTALHVPCLPKSRRPPPASRVACWQWRSGAEAENDLDGGGALYPGQPEPAFHRGIKPLLH